MFLLEELVVHLKICVLRQTSSSFMQDRPFRQCVIIVEFISDDL
jgi:hypothetical protein